MLTWFKRINNNDKKRQYLIIIVSKGNEHTFTPLKINLVADQKLITYEENNVIIITLPSLTTKQPLVSWGIYKFLMFISSFIHHVVRNNEHQFNLESSNGTPQ